MLFWAPTGKRPKAAGCLRKLGRSGLPRDSMLPSLLLSLLSVLAEGASLQPIRTNHLGMCPNQLNPNLWVDAQSTCERECQADQVRRSGGALLPSCTFSLDGAEDLVVLRGKKGGGGRKQGPGVKGDDGVGEQGSFSPRGHWSSW